VDILIILVVVIIVLLYVLYRLWPDRLAEFIKGRVFEDVDEGILLKFIEASRIRREEIDRIDLTWRGWRGSNLDLVMNVLSGYGDAFKYALSMKRFYFRELLQKVGSVKVVRAWVIDASRIGLIRRIEDPHGVTMYKIDREGLGVIRDYIIRALEELL